MAPIVATMMDHIKPPLPAPKRACIMKPPTKAPAIPIRIVTMMPPGSSPGMISLAKAPAISPITIQANIAPILIS
jgi:hypothetical protein